VRLTDLRPIPGVVPDLRVTLPPCRYRSRCEREPPLPRLAVGLDHMVACRVPL
jgi:peptide/nickel transport system ATP-binding protein